MTRNLAITVLLVALAAGPVSATETISNPLTDSEASSDLRFDVVGDAKLLSADGIVTMDAPYRAHDAATVPVQLTQPEGAPRITAATVVIDENPAPVAAEFTFGEAMGRLDFELRVRVDQFSNVRAIVETPVGLHMTGRHVKASGGCSAPATRDPEAALAQMGRMKLKSFDAGAQVSTPRREAQIMIRHPNYSGLQRDQITQLFIPAHFIDQLDVWQGEEMLFSMRGGISISENPVFRFGYDDNESTALRVGATDTDGNVFESVLPNAAGS